VTLCPAAEPAEVIDPRVGALGGPPFPDLRRPPTLRDRRVQPSLGECRWTLTVVTAGVQMHRRLFIYDADLFEEAAGQVDGGQQQAAVADAYGGGQRRGAHAGPVRQLGARSCLGRNDSRQRAAEFVANRARCGEGRARHMDPPPRWEALLAQQLSCPRRLDVTVGLSPRCPARTRRRDWKPHSPALVGDGFVTAA
jgi:hypothetical protein